MLPKTSKLGRRLREVREVRGWSLHTAARKAGVSAAYVQKLERGEVRAPSPHKLQNLARAYAVEYGELMGLAGYGESTSAVSPGAEPMNMLAQALMAESLTQEEIEDLASYLRWRRQEKRRTS